MFILTRTSCLRNEHDERRKMQNLPCYVEKPCRSVTKNSFLVPRIVFMAIFYC